MTMMMMLLMLMMIRMVAINNYFCIANHYLNKSITNIQKHIIIIVDSFTKCEIQRDP